MKPPTRHKDPVDYTPDEHFKALRAEGRGEEFAVETDEYQRYRADGLRALGLEDEADASEPDDRTLEEMSPAEHLADIRSGRR